jgi:hypothetical protein
MQDVTKLVLGGTQSSIKDVSQHNVDPASFPAGVCVSMASTGLPSLLASAGMRMGVSLGKSLSDHKKTAVARTGLRVPVLAHLKRSSGTVTITSYANLISGTADTVTIGGTAFTAQAGAATLGQATFRAATDNNATATSLATQINAHATASTKVYAVASSAIVTLYAVVEGAGTGNDVTTTVEQLGSGDGATAEQAALTGGSNTITDIAYITVGTKMYINNVSGKADIAMTGFSTVSDALYVTTEMTGVMEDGTEVAAVLVDMQGGL